MSVRCRFTASHASLRNQCIASADIVSFDHGREQVSRQCLGAFADCQIERPYPPGGYTAPSQLERNHIW
jgi:hypothetical protein